MFSLNFTQGLIYLYGNGLTTSFQANNGTWNYFSFVMTVLSHNYTQITLFLNSVSQGSFLIDPLNSFNIIPSILIVGNYTGQGFTGFI